MATKLGFNEIQFVHPEDIHNGKNDHQKYDLDFKGFFLPLRRQML